MTKTPQHPIAGGNDAGDKSELDELREQLEESRAEISLLQQINSSLVSNSSLDETLQSIVDGLNITLGYNAATIWMLDADGVTLRCHALAADRDLAALFEKAVGSAVLAGFSEDDYLLNLAPKAAAASGLASLVFVPLQNDNSIIGVLGVGSVVELTGIHLEAVQRFAGQAGLAVEKSRLRQQLLEYPEQLEQEVRERTRELEAVNRIAATVSRSLNLDIILRDSLAKVLEVLELKFGAIFLTDEKKSELNLMVAAGAAGRCGRGDAGDSHRR